MFGNDKGQPQQMPPQGQSQVLPPLVTYTVVMVSQPDITVGAHNVNQSNGCLFFTRMVKVDVMGQEAVIQIAPLVLAAGEWKSVSTDFEGNRITTVRGVLAS